MLNRFINFLKNILLILVIGAIPINLVYPIPLVSIVALSLTLQYPSHHILSLFNFINSYVFSFLFFTAINLWNHLNDLNDDIIAGRSFSHKLLKNYKLALSISIFCYFLAVLYFIFFSLDLRVTPFLIVCMMFTWMYSDRILVGKIIRRFKEWYVTELLTYFVVSPLFFLVLWSFFEPVSSKGLAFSLLVSLLYISGVFLKDMKDITSDANAGYETLAIVFSPQFLIRISILLNLASFVLLLLYSVTGIFPMGCTLSLVVVFIVVYVIFKLNKEKWKISKDMVGILSIYSYTYVFSLLFIALGGFISNLGILYFS